MTVRHRKQRLIECLKELRLPAVRNTYGELAAHARKESLSYERTSHSFLSARTEKQPDSSAATDGSMGYM